MIIVHHLKNSQSFRIVWLLEELGLDYKLKTYERQKDNSAPPDYKAISPLGTSPAIINTDDGLVLCESNAIIDYMLDQAPENLSSSFRPSRDSSHRNEYLFWFHAAQGTFQLNLATDSLMRVLPTRVPWPISIFASIISSKTQKNRIQPKLEDYLILAESHLSKQEYFAGSNLTAADITSVYPMDAAFKRYPSFKERYPNCHKWFQQISNRKAFKKALEKTGDDSVSPSL